MQGIGSPSRYRPMSPGGSHLIDPMRASTGNVHLSSSYDAYDPLGSRQAYSGYRSDAPFVAPYDPRFTREPRLEAQPISATAYREHGRSTKLRTEYAIRPRSNTTTAADAHTSLKRLDIPGGSPLSRNSPVIMSDYGRSPSPLTSTDGYLVPASSSRHHRRPRHSSTEYASDSGRATREKGSHGSYRTHEINGRRRYPQTGSLRKGEDIDDYDAYSYTNPREQFEKDSAAKLRYSRGAYRRDRPLSLTGIDDQQLITQREPKALGPPPSRRGFGKFDYDPELRRSAYGFGRSDGDLRGPQRSSSQRAGVSLHHDPDEGYLSYRDDYDEGRQNHRQHKRPDRETSHRQLSDDKALRKSNHKVPALPALPAPPAPGNGLGTAGLAGGYSDDHDFDLAARGDRHRSRELVVRGADSPGHRSRSRQASRRRAESDSDAYSSDDDLEKYRREPSVAPKQGNPESSREAGGRSRSHVSRSRHRDILRSKDSKSPDEQKRLEVGSFKEADAPPKGILKPPRDKFPEEPNPVREGVAPLKDAHRKGIPPGARWTKIDRRLVNPAALEANQERFEERSEYVIVLRVLTKEEIQGYAAKTQEIRDSRYHEYVKERRRRREEDRRRGRAMDDFSSDDEEEDDDSLLAIDGPVESRSIPGPDIARVK